MNTGSPQRPPRLRERLREATAGAILDAAERAFAAEGPRARMESIAALAGIAVGTLYNHFADREALWGELCRSRRAALLVRLDAALDAAQGLPFEAALRGFLEALAAHWDAHRGFLAVLLRAEPAGGRSPREGPGRSMADELGARAARLVGQGVAEGALRAEDADLYPALLLGMVRGVLLRELEGGAAAGPPPVARVVEVFLHGAGARR
jgi:AcrR family transcriptional regulator